MKAGLQKFLPLSPAGLHILLALAGEEMHGYGIMQEVARQSGGRYKLGPGTLYDNLARMMRDGLVAELANAEESRRRYYRLTSQGRAVLAGEVARLETVIRDARVHLGRTAPGRA
jgi:DNA-binding PadR family transcriptional regulator